MEYLFRCSGPHQACEPMLQLVQHSATRLCTLNFMGSYRLRDASNGDSVTCGRLVDC